MIDHFSLALSHVLMLLIAWRLIFRPDIDDDSAVSGPKTDFFGRPLTTEDEEPEGHA